MAANQNDPNAQKLFDLVRDIRVCMMTTEESDGSLHSRPMYSMEADERGNLWFFTKLQSPKVAEISKDRQVNLAYRRPRQAALCLDLRGRRGGARQGGHRRQVERGRAGLVPGRKGRSLAHPHPRQAGPRRVLGQPVPTFVQLYGYVKSTLTGQPATDVGEQKKVSLR